MPAFQRGAKLEWEIWDVVHMYVQFWFTLEYTFITMMLSKICIVPFTNWTSEILSLWIVNFLAIDILTRMRMHNKPKMPKKWPSNYLQWIHFYSSLWKDKICTYHDGKIRIPHYGGTRWKNEMLIKNQSFQEKLSMKCNHSKPSTKMHFNPN